MFTRENELPRPRWSRLTQLPAPLAELESRLSAVLEKHGMLILRVSLGVVFLWFGALKFFPGLSSAEGLASRTIEVLTFGVVGPRWSMPILATWECAIGVGLVVGRPIRLTLALLFLQMLGTFAPLLLFPGETFVSFPFVATLEGQYIIKNVVLISAGLVLWGSNRKGAES